MSEQTKTKVAILGSGNIGTDILIKLGRSPVLEPVAMIGVEPRSDGLARAARLGLWTTYEGLDAFLADPVSIDVPIVYDATSAHAHIDNAPKLAAAGKTCVDMTPAALGPYVVPPVNLGQHLQAKDVNLVSCGGQASIPIVAAISRVQPVAYAELVASVSTRSAGPATLQNLDKFRETTARGIEQVGGAKRAKADLELDAADPPAMMRNAVSVILEGDAVDEGAIGRSIETMVSRVQQYVPGYKLAAPPRFDGNHVTVQLEVTGAGDYLPLYAGNLDIMTAVAVRVGEDLADSLRQGALEDQCNSTLAGGVLQSQTNESRL
jgi:acetaldehyde dehydrogenase